MPKGGAGRAEDGNFVLSHIGVEVAPADPAKETPTGRFVRVELPGEGKILSLAEVEVLSGGANVAPKGEASQSSTDYNGPAKLANDGNTDGHFFNAKSTTHTGTEANPWWEVKLAEALPIERITVWNRTDGSVGVRLANFRVQVLDNDHKVVWETDVAEPPNPKRDLSPSGSRSVTLTLRGGGPFAGRLPGRRGPHAEHPQDRLGRRAEADGAA